MDEPQTSLRSLFVHLKTLELAFPQGGEIVREACAHIALLLHKGHTWESDLRPGRKQWGAVDLRCVVLLNGEKLDRCFAFDSILGAALVH